MPVYGNLSTMSLCDLLTWGSKNQMTGVLELERNSSCRRIELRKGWIGSCSSDEPSSRLGQFLLSRGKISADQLRDALTDQETSHKRLGLILVDVGALPRAELARQVSAKAEEIVHGLFDWSDAVFRFYEGATLDPDQIEVNLSVDEVIERGTQRHMDLTGIRKVFPSSNVVLRRTSAPAPDSLQRRPMTRRIFDSIDGCRPIAEILLHARASEYLVLRFLHQLWAKQLVEIAEVRDCEDGADTLLDVGRVDRSSARLPAGPSFDAAPSWAGSRATDAGAEPAAAPPVDDLEVEIEVAQRLIRRGEYEAALELLNASSRAHPGETYLRKLIAKAEEAFIASLSRHDLSPAKIPVLEARDEVDFGALGSEASFLTSLIDGRSDIKSLLWLAPLREVDALRILRQMIDVGLVSLREPQGAAAAGAGPGLHADA